MTACNGKWMMVWSENLEYFYKALHCSAEFIEKVKNAGEMIKHDPKHFIEEFHVNKAAGSLTRQIHIGGHEVFNSGEIKFDVEMDDAPNDQRPAKTTWRMESDHVISRLETSSNYKAAISIFAHGDELIVARCTPGITCIQKFQKMA